MRKKISFETFRPIGGYEINSIKQDECSCFNSEVRVTKYKVTVEPIKEPLETIHTRLQDLWDRSGNYHDFRPLQAAAKKHGYELKGTRGNKNANI